MKPYNLHSARPSQYQSLQQNSEVAWSPLSSCATGEHDEDRLVTLVYLTCHLNLQHETLQPRRVNTFELYWQVSQERK
jgi:hypothetical protein